MGLHAFVPDAKLWWGAIALRADRLNAETVDAVLTVDAGARRLDGSCSCCRAEP